MNTTGGNQILHVLEGKVDIGQWDSAANSRRSIGPSSRRKCARGSAKAGSEDLEDL
jgi:hypothetical protein